MKIKLRPVILVIAIGLVVALNGVAWGVVGLLTRDVPTDLATALIAFGGTITTGLVAIAGKLTESEEKSDSNGNGV